MLRATRGDQPNSVQFAFHLLMEPSRVHPPERRDVGAGSAGGIKCQFRVKAIARNQIPPAHAQQVSL